MAGEAELCRARALGGEHARGPWATGIRERRSRGAGRAAGRTIWSAESPAESKTAAADSENFDGDFCACAVSLHSILGEDGEETAAELPACLDLSGVE